MQQKPLDTLHLLMTNGLVIVAVAIVLFLLVITLVNPSEIQVVFGKIWD